jgi:hypothetical protein
VGAWLGEFGDGADSDADRTADGSVQAAIADLQASDGATRAPAALAPGDLLLVLDSDRMQYSVVALVAGGN